MLQSPGQRQIEPLPFPQANPAQPVSLTPASQCLHPLPLDYFADPAELTAAVVQAEVLVEPAQHHRKVVLLFTSMVKRARIRRAIGFEYTFDRLFATKLEQAYEILNPDQCGSFAPVPM